MIAKENRQFTQFVSLPQNKEEKQQNPVAQSHNLIPKIKSQNKFAVLLFPNAKCRLPILIAKIRLSKRKRRAKEKK